MKFSLILSPSAGAAEVQRRLELRRQFKHEWRAQLWTDLRRELFNGARAVFLFLLVVTIVVFVTSHRTEINAVAAQKISRVAAQVKQNGEASLIRQTALNHEKEVEAAAK